MAISLVTNLTLALALMLCHPDSRTIIIPPTLAQERESWIFDNDGVSASYLKRYALSILSYATNLTPDNIESSNKRLLSIVDSESFNQFERSLHRQKETILREHASTTFYIDEVRVDEKELLVTAKGKQVMFVASTLTSKRDCEYVMNFKYNAGRLTLRSLTLNEEERNEI